MLNVEARSMRLRSREATRRRLRSRPRGRRRGIPARDSPSRALAARDMRHDNGALQPAGVGTGKSQTTRLASLGFMVAGVCHEVANPLSAIHSMVQILRSRHGVTPETLERGSRTSPTILRECLRLPAGFPASRECPTSSVFRFQWTPWWRRQLRCCTTIRLAQPSPSTTAPPRSVRARAVRSAAPGDLEHFP